MGFYTIYKQCILFHLLLHCFEEWQWELKHNFAKFYREISETCLIKLSGRGFVAFYNLSNYKFFLQKYSLYKLDHIFSLPISEVCNYIQLSLNLKKVFLRQTLIYPCVSRIYVKIANPWI